MDSPVVACLPSRCSELRLWPQSWLGSVGPTTGVVRRFTGSLTSLRVVLVGPFALGDHRGLSRRGAAVAGTAATALRSRLPPGPPLTVMNATLVAPLVTALTLSFVAVVRAGLPWIVLPKIGAVPRWGAIAVIFVAMDGCNWFAHLANHRVRMLWRFHELHHSQEDMSVLTVFRTHPLIHVSYLLALDPGRRASGQRGAVDHASRHLRRHRRVRPLQHQPRFRAARTGLRQPELSPHPPPIGRTTRRQPRLRAHDLGSDLPSRRVSEPKTTVRIDTGLPGRPLIVEQARTAPATSRRSSPPSWWRRSAR